MNNPILDSILKRLEQCLKDKTYTSLETEIIYFKDLSTWNNWNSLKETVSAFLNSHSGIIVTGIKEREEKYTLTGYNALNEHNYLNLRFAFTDDNNNKIDLTAVSYTHLRAHETVLDLVCRLLLEKKKKQKNENLSNVPNQLK